MSWRSIVEYCGGQNKNKCGYCKQENGSNSHGMWAHQLTVGDYQDLINRGWRRSGRYCYKPTMNNTCCPLYTIRCEALDIKLTKSQKKIIKKVNKYLTNGIKDKSTDTAGTVADVIESDSAMGCEENVSVAISFKPADDACLIQSDVEICDVNLVYTTFGENSTEADSSNHVKAEELIKINKPGDVKTEKPSTTKDGLGADASKPPSKKAKLLRMERRKEKLKEKGINLDEIKPKKFCNAEKTLEDLLNDIPQNALHKLEIKLVPVVTVKSNWNAPHSLYTKYQMSVHNDPKEKCTRDQFLRFLVKGPLQCKLVSVGSDDFKNTLKPCSQLFAKYQMAVHKEKPDECDMSVYADFLCDSPIKPDNYFGSYHQQYYLDGKLIAVGVIDILPQSVSSVYFYYDPEYSHLSLGTYGSLREVALVRELQKKYKHLRYYYMGFYIHNCQKMRYKAKLSPSYLLCPVTYKWFPIEKCIPKIEASAYTILSENATDEDDNLFDATSLDNLLILYQNTAMPYLYYKKQNTRANYGNEVQEYAQLVGKTCGQKMLLYREFE